MIETLKQNQIFVFGSNLAGKHYGGAARQANNQFDAQMGVGEGLTGKTYAFPTLDENFGMRSDEEITKSVEKFFECVIANPDLEFLLTKVGCGIAGYEEEYMIEKFKHAPGNIVKPEGW
jgi:hypothetical protein